MTCILSVSTKRMFLPDDPRVISMKADTECLRRRLKLHRSCRCVKISVDAYGNEFDFEGRKVPENHKIDLRNDS